jgi:hypothetical protein
MMEPKMRIVAGLAVAATVVTAASAASAQTQEQHAVVHQLVGSAPRPDGTHSLTFALKDGTRLTLDVPKEETIKVISGLSVPTGDGRAKQEVVAVVQKMAIGVDPTATAIVMIPISSVGPLQALAIPIAGAESFVQLFQKRLGEARAKSSADPKAK